MRNKYFTKDHALDTNLLDSYVKDTIGSFLMFFMVIGPVAYDVYFKKGDADEEPEDGFVNMLNKQKDR